MSFAKPVQLPPGLLEHFKGLTPRGLDEVQRRTREAMAVKSLELYRPYPKQLDFHRSGAPLDVRERLLIAGNQCISPWTFVETPHGSVQSAVVFASTGANVVSLVGESECVAQLQGGFLKGIEPAYRFVMESGLFFDCSEDHQVATEQGYLHISRLMSLSSGLHCWRKGEDFQASCVADGYLCDPRLLSEEGIDQGRFPLRAGVLNSSLSFSQADAEGRISQCTSFFRLSGPLTTADGGPILHADLYAQFAGAFSSQPALRLTDGNLKLVQSRCESGPNSPSRQVVPGQPSEFSPKSLWSLVCSDAASTPERRALSNRESLQSFDVLAQGCSLQELHRDESRIAIFYPCEHPKLVGGERIVAVIPIGYQPILDASVPGPNNYKAGGVYHHNCGKTWAAGFELAMHLTGEYPEWWPGAVFDEPIVGWAASETGQSTRDTVQRILLGQPGSWGTGAIPKRAIHEIKKSPHGVADAVETVLVKHKSGGLSRVTIKTYDQGRERWQGETLSFVWFDEEPPEDIYFEGLTRTNATGGLVTLTFTPLKGMSNVVRRFLQTPQAGQAVTTMTIDDAGHYTAAQRAAIVATYPEHEREARTLGIPTLGEGRIFPVPEKEIVIEPFSIPEHWPQIGGIDFGWSHPTAAARLAWDRDSDTIYVTADYRVSKDVPAMHATALKAWGTWIPWAWPHDGLQHDKGSGEALADQYRKHGLNMLKDKATHPAKRGEPEGSGGNGVEAGIQQMLERMLTGRWKVFSSCGQWIDEFRSYHREDGKIVKERDDVISSSRYAMMMIRKAITKPLPVGDDYQAPAMLDAAMGY